MRGLLKFLAIALLICGALYSSGVVLWDAVYPSCTMRYRLTVDVDDAGTRKVGSAVVEATLTEHPLFVSDSGPAGWSFRGFAITVNLGNKGLLFLINRDSRTRSAQLAMQGGKITSSFLARLPEDLFDHEPHNSIPYSNNAWQALRNYCRAINQYESQKEIPVPVALLPMFVRFRDPDLPESLEEVNPANLSETYGPGASLKSVTLRIVYDPISPMPTNWPKWLKDKISSGDWQTQQWSTAIGTFDTGAFAGE